MCVVCVYVHLKSISSLIVGWTFQVFTITSDVLFDRSPPDGDRVVGGEIVFDDGGVSWIN